MREPSFRQTQYQFAAYIRDPKHNPMPAGVKPERMRLYRELFFNNIQSFISNGFPVLKTVLEEAHWQALVEDFFATHQSKTPYFAEVNEEFLQYLREERGGHAEDPPFLLELAHYEWVELALSVSEAEAPARWLELEQNPLACVISLSEVAWPLAYQFPVQLIGWDFQPSEPPPELTLLAVYRDREDHVRFLEVNPAVFRLLQILEQEGPTQAEECLRRIAAELGHADPAAVLAYGFEILRGLAERGVIGKSA